MNREEIVALAEKAGFERLFPNNEDWVCFTEEIERFYKMAVAAEREALAEDSSGNEQPAQQQEPKKFDPNESFAREEAAQARVREFMRNH